MYKLLIDSDALIKISKAEFLDVLIESFYVLITEEIYDETVIEGKKGFHQDADKIDSLIKNNDIKILKRKNYTKRPKQGFGRGEVSLYQAYKKDTLIVTDDLRFTSYIKKEHMKHLSSAHLLFVLFKKDKLKKDKAYYCLEKLKPFIRKELYELVKKDIIK